VSAPLLPLLDAFPARAIRRPGFGPNTGSSSIGHWSAEISPDADPDVVLDLIYGPRLLQTHLPLSDRFTKAVVDRVVAGVRSGQLANGKSKKA
jgi:hypothetical protein